MDLAYLRAGPGGASDEPGHLLPTNYAVVALPFVTDLEVHDPAFLEVLAARATVVDLVAGQQRVVTLKLTKRP